MVFQTPPLEGALPTVMSTFAVRRGGEGVSPNVGQGHGAFGIGQRKVGDGLPQTRRESGIQEAKRARGWELCTKAVPGGHGTDPHDKVSSDTLAHSTNSASTTG